MAFLTTDRNANTGRKIGTGIIGSVAGFFTSLAESFRQYRVFRQTYDELNRLSQRELNDLGIHRSMITRIAMEQAYGA